MNNRAYVTDFMFELLVLYDLYVNKCTKQEEKFTDFRYTIAYTWDDVLAAVSLVKVYCLQYDINLFLLSTLFRHNRVEISNDAFVMGDDWVIIIDPDA